MNPSEPLRRGFANSAADFAAHNLAEQLPALALEFHELHFLNRRKSSAFVLMVIPGNRVPDEKSIRPAACRRRH